MIKKMKTARIFNIQRFSTEDGPGIRTTIFMKGCPLSCIWCHNPEGINLDIQMMWIKSKCRGCHQCIENCPEKAIMADSDKLITDPYKCKTCGLCAEICLNNAREISGRNITLEETVNIVKRDEIFYKKSGGGVTVSGGEASLQWEFVRDFLKCCRDLNIQTALDTCGFVKRQILDKILDFCDLVLYDLKLADSLLHKKYTGADLDLILENAHYISGRRIPMWIRIPVVPNYTDTPANIRDIARIIRSLDSVKRVDLLSYHRLGESKYIGLGMKYQMETELAAPSKEKMEELRDIVNKTIDPSIKVTCN